jgi:hypothetical protein
MNLPAAERAWIYSTAECVLASQEQCPKYFAMYTQFLFDGQNNSTH